MNATLGLGTYRIAGEELADAARRAASSPAAWIDTAPNYTGGCAHRLLAPVLANHPGLRVATKTGFLTPGTARAALAAGVLDQEDAAAGHSLHAPYVRWRLERNRAELGRHRLDTLFLHNPERTTRPDQLHDQLRAAFAVLEEAAAAGHLTTYGIATWSGFTEHRITVPDLDRLAAEAAGAREHHLRALQLPVSLVMADAFDQALVGRGPIADAAALGWQVHASAPLHGGELPTLATRELAGLLRPGASIPAVCLAASASCPGVSMLMLSTGNPGHWDEALAALDEGPIPAESMRKVLDVLAAPQ
ncbi:aldo/keto reductase [Streptomyces sp. NPDC002730]|uniref:aldo/keto reductase n=1 Tax=Streptomyces sp. NPDC002730 TaxID=3364662 RepID=UPI00368F0288